MATPAKLLGVVLRTVDYGESDRVVTLLSAERGKVALFARGARASRRRFGGALEPFTLLAAEARERRGSDLLQLDSASVTRAFGGIRQDLARIACASYASELSRELVREAEPHPELLALLVDLLGRLDAAPASPTGLRAFELAALGAVGLKPRLAECARCGAEVEPDTAAERGERERAFDPEQGGILCGRCSAAAPATVPRVSLSTWRELRRLQAEGLAAATRPLAAPAGREARDALSAFVEHHLGHRLASRKFLDEVGPLLG